MRRINLILVLIAFLLSACNSDQVKVRGKVEGLNGPVKLMAEMPGRPGLTILAEQEVKDGNIDLRTDSLKIPARVWVDIDGKRTLEIILDTKDMIWIKGKIKFPTEIEANGSGLMDEYENIKKQFKEKYEEPIKELEAKNEKIANSKKKSKDYEMLMGVNQLRIQRYLKMRANWAKALIEANPGKEVSLFILKDELVDSLDAQKALFKKMMIENKESNIYKVLEDKLK
ncbi:MULTISPECIES: hypothetical protein [Porphyromonadaceae]|uniref:DUF4369 domain-containing protein n=1 Tax=Sanguibacteroides justesenii TaxID=1547597 RepID=A0A0C3M902_9PORP|nr:MULTISPECIES: hypothetical protein [Porphyromonadaceae]KIO42898.1 hypothetical protein BA92_13620 [Sanguibacteroides justesenii]KIO46151.1 hypothetical protein IE90_04940 [Sanguibacteroides justesenii]MCR9010871.1 hypothetical protein [Gabonibacter chumensis]PXZ44418.1 hypothetical protein DMB45_06060 [Sanguibacteroides justesenii]